MTFFLSKVRHCTSLCVCSISTLYQKLIPLISTEGWASINTCGPILKFFTKPSQEQNTFISCHIFQVQHNISSLCANEAVYSAGYVSFIHFKEKKHKNDVIASHKCQQLFQQNTQGCLHICLATEEESEADCQMKETH